MKGLILFGHGARDPRWAEPFVRLRDAVAMLRPDAVVTLAYLELMTPDLDAAADALLSAGCTTLAIVPIFFGQGSHLRRDLPAKVDALRARLPAVGITVAVPVGEDDAVIAAVADYCVRATAT